MATDWDRSAQAWIQAMSDGGDWARRSVLDPVMLQRAGLLQARRVLDVGCGEGRFCRLLASSGASVLGVDPTEALIESARQRHPEGSYTVARAEELPFTDGAFDLVVSYLSLVDVGEIGAAAAEMTRVLAPGGRLLIANLSSHNTAGRWLKADDGSRLGYLIDHYLDERSIRQQWDGIDIVNWHRPLSTYMQAFLACGLRLSFFDEPRPVAGQDRTKGSFERCPWFIVMEWAKD
jgi:SAM-dependent methyltransferase